MDRYLALEASAGSGKTYNLALRFVGLILNGANIHEITALTFTKKAANEMKGRIVDTFLNLDSDKKRDILNSLSVSFAKTPDEIIKIRDKRLDEFLSARLNISTFDSFFSFILKSFALNSGLDPNFSVDDGVLKDQNQKFIDEICKDVKLLRKIVFYVASSQKTLQSFLDELNFFASNQIEPTISQNANFPNSNNIKNLFCGMREICLRNGVSDRGMKQFEAKSVKDILAKNLITKESLEYSRSDFNRVFNASSADGARLDTLLGELKQALKSYLYELERYSLNELADFLNSYKDTKLSVSKATNLLTFSDISAYTAKLFKTHNVDELYFRLDARINHLLIDEFQDTSVLQYEILKPLIDEIVSGWGQSADRSLFYVGDKKQSIYKFRGGKKEIFDDLQNAHTHIKKESLDTNYRSLKLLVKFVNIIFSQKFRELEEENSFKNLENIQYINQLSHNDTKEISSDLDSAKEYIKNHPICEFTHLEIENDDYGYIKVVSTKDEESELNPVVKATVDEIKNLLQKGALVDEIAILCWKNSDVTMIKEALENSNIISSTNRTKPLFETLFVAAIVEYVKYFFTKESIYFKNVESLLGKKVPVLELNLQKTSLENLKFICEILEIDMSDENVLLFLESVSGFENLSDLCFKRPDIGAFSQSENGVKIMTVHKSKGLQFNHMILCDRIGKSTNGSSNFLCDYDFEKNSWEIRHNLTNKEFVDESFKALKDRLKWLEYEEDINKLYVAFTRAKHSLVVIKNKTPNGNNPSYFSPYISNKESIKYLDLPEFEYGYICKKQQIKPSLHPKKEISLVKIPSQEKDSSQADEELSLNDLYFGNALHYALEISASFDEISLKKALSISKSKFMQFLDGGAFKEIEKRLLNLANSTKFSSLIKGGKIYKEVSFKIDGEIKRMDLLVEFNDKITIFDYKSSRNNELANRAQVQFYKDSVTKFTDKKISAYLLFLLPSALEILEV
ncbi:MAG: RecB-like helicase [Campylobacter sp.]|nr:RecB-like helicase [Campylobacter sp.]